MKPRYAVIVFALMLSTALLCSIGSYHHARQRIVGDMNQALQKTLAQKQDLWLTPDTIRNYRSHLQIAALRGQSFVGYDMVYDGLHSQRFIHRRGSSRAVFRSYANCSPLTVFRLADHRLPALLWLTTLLWGAATIGILHRSRQLCRQLLHVGTLCYDEADGLFVDAQMQPVHLTPMQQQLLQMFFHAEGHRLTKQTICDTLWPKKPDASETLYTLVRRLKPVIEQHSNLQIVSDRGKAYQLTIKESST